MSRFFIEFCPRRSWQPDVDSDDQRWTRTPNVFSGSETEATLECSELDAAYDRACVFRAVAIEPAVEELAHQYCAGCGGDLRIGLGRALSCSCEVAVAASSGIRWVKPARRAS